MRNIKNILVLFGGQSTEHAVSCRSAYTIIKGLREAGFQVSIVGISLEGEWLPFRIELENILADNWAELAKQDLAEQPLLGPSMLDMASPKSYLEYLAGMPIDLVYLAMHGITAEDGSMQGLLEICGLPYVGTEVLGSAVCMDKDFTKRILRNYNIPLLPFVTITRYQLEQHRAEALAEIEELFYPLFLKPANGGSSVGTYKVKNHQELELAIDKVAQYDEKILCEPFYPAREIELACLGNQEVEVAEPGEIVKSASIEYYDYASKYLNDTTKLDIPAQLQEETKNKLKTYAKYIYKALGIKGYARLDFFVSKDEAEIYFNEVNTLPGFTDISLFPQAWKNEGIDLANLLKRISYLAIDNYDQGKRALDVQN